MLIENKNVPIEYIIQLCMHFTKTCDKITDEDIQLMFSHVCYERSEQDIRIFCKQLVNDINFVRQQISPLSIVTARLMLNCIKYFVEELNADIHIDAQSSTSPYELSFKLEKNTTSLEIQKYYQNKQQTEQEIRRKLIKQNEDSERQLCTMMEKFTSLMRVAEERGLLVPRQEVLDCQD